MRSKVWNRMIVGSGFKARAFGLLIEWDGIDFL